MSAAALKDNMSFTRSAADRQSCIYYRFIEAIVNQ
jgi:hypothetical protein